MTTRAELISDELQRQRDDLVDYSAIARRTEELGFPVSVRTLRFYVNEGLLPPPHKLGRTSVFPADDTLDRLLVIHLLQTHFHRSLGEIKPLLDRVRPNASELADKCALFYRDLTGRDLDRAAREWAGWIFVESLTGAVPFYPRSRRADPGPREAREILITEIFEDLDEHSRWSSSESGDPHWISPIEALNYETPPEGTSMTGTRTPSGVSITPLSPPEGSVTVASARSREEQFLRRFERNLHRIKRLYHPGEKRYYSVKPSQLDPVVDDPYQKVVDLLKELKVYDRALLDSLPHDRATRYLWPTPGLFGRKKPRLVVGAVARSPLADLARLGGVREPLGESVVYDTIREQNRDPGAYHVFGILSTVGWEARVMEQVPRGEDFSVVLVEPLPRGGWRLADSLPKKLAEIRAVFDPEEQTEKVSRTFYRLMEEPELAIPGGHVEVETLLLETGVDREILERALDQVRNEDSRIGLTRVANREIIKRDRY